MELEKAVFERKQWDFSLMEKYGFVRKDEKYVYEKTILNGEFKTVVEVDASGKVQGSIVDLSLDEEYENWKIASVRGEFVGKVREAYSTILEEIAANCMHPSFFVSAQANRVAEWILREYGDRPESVFRNAPGHGLFRHPESQKWYGLILTIDLAALTGTKRNGEILNLKIDPAESGTIRERKGIFPAYHMHKQKWISVVLDGSVDDAFLFHLIATSRLLAAKGENRSKR